MLCCSQLIRFLWYMYCKKKYNNKPWEKSFKTMWKKDKMSVENISLIAAIMSSRISQVYWLFNLLVSLVRPKKQAVKITATLHDWYYFLFRHQPFLYARKGREMHGDEMWSVLLSHERLIMQHFVNEDAVCKNRFFVQLWTTMTMSNKSGKV